MSRSENLRNEDDWTDENESDWTDDELDMLAKQELAELAVPLAKLDDDVLQAARLSDQLENRYILSTYYRTQKPRVAAKNQYVKLKEVRHPRVLLGHLIKLGNAIESQVGVLLGEFARQYTVGRVMQSVYGIGEILSASALARLNIPPPPTAGHWIRFAGLDPSQIWVSSDDAKKIVERVMTQVYGLNKEDRPPPSLWKQWLKENFSLPDGLIFPLADAAHIKPSKFVGRLRWIHDMSGHFGTEMLWRALSLRPWNNDVRLMCFHVGRCFKFVANKKNGEKINHYGPIYLARRKYEEENNAAGNYKEVADKYASKVGPTTKAYTYYKKGLLPPGHVVQRCCRYTAKRWLQDVHTMFFWDYYGKAPPAPYIFRKTPSELLAQTQIPAFHRVPQEDDDKEYEMKTGLHTRYMPPPLWPPPANLRAKSLRDLAFSHAGTMPEPEPEAEQPPEVSD